MLYLQAEETAVDGRSLNVRHIKAEDLGLCKI